MSNDRRHPNVVNKDEVAPSETKQGSFHVHTRRFGPHAGNQQLGATLTEVPAGARSYPFHYHCANEEALYIISGTGTCRIGVNVFAPFRGGPLRYARERGVAAVRRRLDELTLRYGPRFGPDPGWDIFAQSAL